MKGIVFRIVLLLFVINLQAQITNNSFSRLHILFAGDLMLHQSQLNAALTQEDTYSFSDCFKHIKKEVSKADISIGNLEVVIGGSPYSGYPMFCAPDSFLHAIENAGFNLLLTANNHCLDRGSRGLKRTLQMLDSLGIPNCGTYVDSVDRAQRYPLLVMHKGFRVAILNYTYGINGITVPKPIIVNTIDKSQIEKDIRRAKEMNVDIIIACMHWGDEFVSLPSQNQKELSKWLLSQGVDHIIGSHPHVLQPMEVRKNEERPSRHVVVYSLGNIISGMYARARDGGAMVNLHFQKIGNIVRLSSCNYRLTWVARPERDGIKNFEIWNAANPPSNIGSTTKSKLHEFVTDTRLLFTKHNIEFVEISD